MAESNTLRIHGLHDTVQLWRDQWGIPHIDARSDHDAFVALGYAHAQDRLWQMEMQRRKAVGRWAEWKGADALFGDTLARRLGGARVAQRDYAALDAETVNMLESYATGVNAYINSVDIGDLPLEYQLLGTRPEAWLPWHSIAVMRQIGFLMGSFWMKLFRAAALAQVGEENIGKLRYDDGGNDLLCVPSGASGQRWGVDLAMLQPSIAELLQFAPHDATGGGSNNWAVGPQLTESGRPILMGDPHRELEVLSMYSQAHLRSPNFDVIGLTIPGVPGFPHVGHNAHTAWCVTVAFVDMHDLYIERFRDGGTEYQTSTGWEKTVQRTELIAVRGEKTVEIDIVETAHGPLIIGDPAEGCGLALKSIQFAETDHSFDCLLRMQRATSIDELFESTRDWGLIDHNLVAADTHGHIGHRVRGKVPDRSRHNGWLPVPGWLDAYEWRGIVPFESMPTMIDPGNHLIVTANNRVSADVDWPYLSTDCIPPHRAQRITRRLAELDRYSIDSMKPIFGDLVSIPAALFQRHLAELALAHPEAAALRAMIVNWDGRMGADSAHAAAYSVFRVELARLVGERCGLISSNPVHEVWQGWVDAPAVVSHLWWIVPTLLRDDDTSLLGGQRWTDVLTEALQRAASALPAAACWSDLHTPRLEHPLSRLFPEAANVLNLDCVPVGGDGDTVMATAFNAGQGLRTVYSSLARYAFDVGNWSNSEWIAFQGVSGAPGNPHRSDQNRRWGELEMVPMLYDWTDIAKQATLCRLLPNLSREGPA
ncbi:penicillin acylase family protein [Caballeronia sp. LjRoot34]|uniref:penicillin acylase family protein n=1 Tax=Caballeronia sp. LjRoot34 TaxID=3342325 RepID=UPI003ECFD57F